MIPATQPAREFNESKAFNRELMPCRFVDDYAFLTKAGEIGSDLPHRPDAITKGWTTASGPRWRNASLPRCAC